jgi:Protein of unknown function (DUF3500)
MSMLYESTYYCPECDDGRDHRNTPSRRDFIRTIGGGTVALVAGGVLSTRLLAADAVTSDHKTKPAEDLVRELYASLSGSQRAGLVYPWDHQSDGVPTRLSTFNRPVFDKRIGDVYTSTQQELVERVVRAIMADDDAFDRLSRNNTWDSSGSFGGCGAVMFGDPEGEDLFSWVFAGHHLTLRCDGNSHPGAAFGGPLYYGHSAGGYSDKNVYLYQTQQVHAVFDALDPEQRKQALTSTHPGDGKQAIRFRSSDEPRPGIGYAELAADQQALVQHVMRTLLGPFRKQDGDEVMELIRVNGGMEKIHLAFYRDGEPTNQQRWHVWRLEGPGFVWNFRVLPHVHCFVNVATVS